jgi:Spermine/spermidine synthase domain
MELKRDLAALPASAGFRLFAISFTALFLELMMIRWAPAVVDFVAYYGNLLLISSFLGLGLGAMLADRKWRLIALFPVLLLLNVEALAIFHRALAAPGVGSEARFMQNGGALRNYLTLLGVFAGNTLVFVPLGQEIGRLFKIQKPLRAYGFDLGGSIAGTLGFGIFSICHFSPIIGFAIVAAIYFLATQGRQRLFNLPILAMLIYMAQFPTDPNAFWSPYYYITVHRFESSQTTRDAPRNLRTMMNPPMYSVAVNTNFYQVHGTLDPRRYTPGSLLGAEVGQLRRQYLLPYMLHPACKSVCVVGAGGGLDVEAALLSGARSVDAVEIDPMLKKLSHRFSAADIYSDPRVHARIDDGRAFLQSSGRQYDMVVFGLLDSHTLFSYSSNIRLDGFIYTVQSMRRAYSRLKPDGALSVTFQAARPWLVDKLKTVLHDATGRWPIVYRDMGLNVMLVPRGAAPATPRRIGRLTRDDSPAAAIDPSTDDWPYLYLSRRTIPPDYLAVIAALVGLSAAAVMGLRIGRRRGGVGRLDEAHFFFLGLGFLLLETKSIGDCSLYFGTTWLVTMIVVTGVLLMVLAANLLAMRMQRAPIWLYAPLLGALVGLYITPREQILAMAWAERLMWALFCVPLPIFFAGLIFSVTFRDGKDPARLLGANLIGATIGGFCDYLAMATGAHALMLIIMGAYAASLLCRGVGSGFLSGAVAAKDAALNLANPVESRTSGD